MSQPVRCVTCGTTQYKKELYMKKKMQEISADPKLSEVEKEKAKKKLIKRLYPSYCCRGRANKYIDRVTVLG